MNLDIRITPWRDPRQTPGFVSEEVEARVDGVRAGYLRWVYLPFENVDKFYGDWQAYAKNYGKMGTPERQEQRRQIMLEWFVDKPTVAFVRVFEEYEADERDDRSLKPD